MDSERIISEARAKIIWGDSPESVRAFLIVSGIAAGLADATIAEFVAERNQEIRGIGIRNICVGVFLAGVAGSVLWWICSWYFAPVAPKLSRNSDRSTMMAVVILTGLTIYGIAKLVNGILYVVRPQLEHKSISDLEE